MFPLVRSAGIVGAAAALSRVLGVVRDVVLARYFGAGNVMDAFNIATRIPALLRELFAEGAMSSALVPIFLRRSATGEPGAGWRLASIVLNALLATTVAAVVLGVVFADQLTRLYAGSYAGEPAGVAGFDDKLALTITLTRIAMPFLALMALAAVMSAMLNAVGRFFIPAFSPAAYNIVLTLSAIGSAELGRHLGFEPILGLAAGFVFGGLAQVLIHWPALRHAGYRHRWVLDPADRGLREVLTMMGTGTVGQAAAQVNILVNLWLATGEGAGAVSWLTYASRVAYVPIGIFGVSLATAALPEVARHAAVRATDEVRRTVLRSLRLGLMLAVPASVGLFALAAPVVALLFEGREFLARDSRAVAAALMCYAPGIVAYTTIKLVSPVFYAYGDARTPMLVSVGSVAANILLNFALVRLMGYLGLALGATLAGSIAALILLAILARRLGGLDGPRTALALARITLASIVMGAAAFEAEAFLRGWFPAPTLVHRLVCVSGAASVGIAVLLAAAHVLRIEELRAAIQRLRP